MSRGTILVLKNSLFLKHLTHLPICCPYQILNPSALMHSLWASIRSVQLSSPFSMMLEKKHKHSHTHIHGERGGSLIQQRKQPGHTRINVLLSVHLISLPCIPDFFGLWTRTAWLQWFLLCCPFNGRRGFNASGREGRHIRTSAVCRKLQNHTNVRCADNVGHVTGDNGHPNAI